MIEGAGGGSGVPVTLDVAVAPIGTPLGLTFADVEGLTAVVDFGDGTQGDETTTTHAYAGAGVFDVVVETQIGGLPPQSWSFVVGRVDNEARTADGGIHITQPSNPFAAQVLGALLPRIHVGAALATASPALVLGQDLDLAGGADPDTTRRFEILGSTGTFTTTRADLPLSVRNPAGGYLATVTLLDVQLSGSVQGGALQSPLHLAGNLVLVDVVDGTCQRL